MSNVYTVVLLAASFLISIPAFAGEDGLDLPHRNKGRIDDVENHLGDKIDTLKGQIRRLQKRQDNLCTGPADSRKVVCKQDLRALESRILRFEKRVQENDGNIKDLSYELSKLQRRVIGVRRDHNDLKKVVEARHLSFGAGVGYQGVLLPGSGWRSNVVGDISLTYETAVAGGTVHGDVVFNPGISTLGGGGWLGGYGFLDDDQVLGLGGFLGGSTIQYDIVDKGAWHQQLATFELGPMLSITPLRGDTGSLNVTLRGGVKVGVLTFASPLTNTVNPQGNVGTTGFLELTFGPRIDIPD